MKIFFISEHSITRTVLTTVHGEIVYFGKAGTAISPASGDARSTGLILGEEMEDDRSQKDKYETSLMVIFTITKIPVNSLEISGEVPSVP